MTRGILDQPHLVHTYSYPQIATPNMIFSVTYYSGMHGTINFYYWDFFYQVKLSIFYNVQTTNLTFVGKKYELYSA